MRIFAQNFRGFKEIELDLGKINFLVGDNSSGKSSLLHLVDCVMRSDLSSPPRMNDDLGVGVFDYFSPYFSDADVTFGFTIQKDGAEFSKIITVTKGKIDPFVKSCSYISDDMAITIKRGRTKIGTRVIKGLDHLNDKERLNIHHKPTGFSQSTKLPARANLGEPGIVFAFVKFEDIQNEDFIPILFGDILPAARLISPLRALPEKFYTLKRKISAKGSHFAVMLLDLSKGSASERLADVETFGKESGLFESIKIRRLANNVSDSPLIASVVKSGREFFLNQVGVGVSQVVPVLVETIFATTSRGSIKSPILIQQPELHLHPVAQAALGTFFYKSACKGVRGLLETHSSYLIDRFRAEIRDQGENESAKFAHTDAVIIFCENSTEGNLANMVEILADGQIKGEPEGYHRFFIDELMRTMF